MAEGQKLAHFIPGLESSFIFADPADDRALEYDKSKQDESIAEYIRFLDTSASKPEKQAFYEAAYDTLLEHFKKVDQDEDLKETGKYKKMWSITDKVENLHLRFKKETKDEPLLEFPDLRWHFFDASVKLWGMKLGFEAGAPNFVVPSNFQTTTFPHFYDLVYKYMLCAPDRERVLSNNNADALRFLQLSMKSVVADAVLYQATFGLRTPVTGNIAVENNKITCKALFRDVSNLLHHAVCHKLGWNMTTALLQKEVKTCKDPKHINSEYSSFYNCEKCFELNHGKKEDFEKQVKSMIVLRVLLCKNIFEQQLAKTGKYLETLIFQSASGWVRNSNDINTAIGLILELTKTWLIADAVSYINEKGGHDIYDKVAAKCQFLDVFDDKKNINIAKLFLDPGAITSIP